MIGCVLMRTNTSIELPKKVKIVILRYKLIIADVNTCILRTPGRDHAVYDQPYLLTK